MTTKDVIKSSVYESIVNGVGMTDSTVIMILLTAVVIGVYIFLVYKLTGKAAFYSRDLNVTLAGLPVIVAAIMIAMQTNLVVSLGMVGALSIVRFRNAVKNPLDLLFLFWSITAGIICGVGLEFLVILLCIIMTVLIFVLQLLPNTKATSILIVRTSDKDADWEMFRKTLGKYAGSVKEKSRNRKGNRTELLYELYTKKEEELLKAVNQYEWIEEVHYMAHDGEYRI